MIEDYGDHLLGFDDLDFENEYHAFTCWNTQPVGQGQRYVADDVIDMTEDTTL